MSLPELVNLGSIVMGFKLFNVLETQFKGLREVYVPEQVLQIGISKEMEVHKPWLKSSSKATQKNGVVAQLELLWVVP